MKHNEAIKQYLTQAGWTYKGSCNCGGMPTYKYQAGEYKLRVRALHFLISTPATKFTKWPISELKTMIDEISPATKAVIQAEAKDEGIPK